MQSDSSSGEGRFQVRKLESSDKSKGFIELLQQLTICDSVSDQDFEDRFQELAALGDDHVIGVIEDDRNGKIVASGSVFIEKKFIRNCGKVGHIEDVVVDFNARGMQLGKRVIEFLVDHARSMGCYKVILDCSDENRKFYEKCGFERKEIQMLGISRCIRFEAHNPNGSFDCLRALELIVRGCWRKNLEYEEVEAENERIKLKDKNTMNV